MVNILGIVQLFLNYINGLLQQLNTIVFSVGSVNLTYLDLLLGYIAMLLIFSVFLKGAKT